MAGRVKDSHPLNGFFAHGVPRTDNVSGNQYITQCPFCEREEKFYINTENKCWDCKVCGKSGNYLNFLEEISNLNAEHIDPKHIAALAEDRNLPIEAFQNYGIGWDGQKFTFPSRDYDGKFTGLKMYRPNHSFYNAKDTKPELFCAFRLKENTKDPIFIAEGEWDAIALTWLLKRLNKPGVVVGVPGALTFKEEWASYFHDRDVIALYDNDAAGEKGEMRCYGLLEGIAANLRFVHWPTTKPEGYDTRDLVGKLAYRQSRPKKALRQINRWLQPIPREFAKEADIVRGEDGKYAVGERRKENLEPISFAELMEEFKSFLIIPDITPIKVMLATVLANRISGDMVWMFMVAPPSSAKTEYLTSLFQCAETVSITSLTPQTLISGFIGIDKKDHSLLPKLKDKVLVIKDFTGVLSMPDLSKNAIFGQLRDAYDGRSEKMFGHGINRVYKDLQFGILAGVTNTIENINVMQQTLGERFLRYYLPINDTETEIMQKSLRAMSNVSHERDKQKKLQECVKRFLGTFQSSDPTISEEMKKKIIFLARTVAKLRGLVPRDFRGDKILYLPQQEGPFRVIKQLYKMAVALANLEGKEDVTDEEFEIIRQIGLGSCPSKVVSVVHFLFRNKGRLFSIFEIMSKVGFNHSTILAVVTDLVMLKLVVESGRGRLKYYTLSDETLNLIKQGGVFSTENKFLLNGRVRNPAAINNGASQNGSQNTVHERRNRWQIVSKGGSNHLN